MMSKKSPQLRFEGFTDDWEQRKLGDVGKTKSGIGFPDAQQGGKQGTPFYKVSDMNNPGNEVVMMNANNYASDSQLKENKWNPINPQNSGVVFAKVGAAIFLDRKRIVDTSFLIDNNMMSYLFDSSWNRYFGKTLFEKLRLSRFAQVGALPSFNGSDVEDIKVMIPEESEQKMIGDMFEKLDDIIALHQRKLDLLKEQKKGFLQKMFPKNGEKVPELRFAGFADDWEEHKLSDIADKAVDNRGKTPTISEDGNHPLLEVASLGNGAPDYSKVTKYLSDETFMTELRAYIKEGDILFSTVGSIGLVSLMDTNENTAIAQNIVAFRANEKYDSKFLYAMLSTKNNQHKAQRIVMGGVQPSIKVSQLVNVDYCVTENMEEQRKIGEYFFNLDNLITLHQRKLDLLKEQKKGFLQKMFV